MHLADVLLKLLPENPKALRRPDRSIERNARMLKIFDSAVTEKLRKSSRISALILGSVALLWFLLRVIPKPSRASYPCQRAAFPLASAFVLWACGSTAGLFSALLVPVPSCGDRIAHFVNHNFSVLVNSG
jgi:hypothetical protein